MILEKIQVFRIIYFISISIILLGCRINALSFVPTPTPLPGWLEDASDLLLNEDSLPSGWREAFPEDIGHPRANHVGRLFIIPDANSSARVTQLIWRGYTIEAAEGKYDELLDSTIHPSFEPSYESDELVLEWIVPSEISSDFLMADEKEIVCGWREWAECRFLARYRNYVTLLYLSREAELSGLQSDGLTYKEIEEVIRAVDVQFTQALTQFSSTNQP